MATPRTSTLWYAASSMFGWHMVFDASGKREATSFARSAASGASLMPTDIDIVRPATDDDVREYEAMGGVI